MDLLLALFRSIDISIKFNTVMLGFSIVEIKGSQVTAFKNIYCTQKIDFVLVNSADPDEMPHHAIFLLDLNCLGFLVLL